MRNDWPERGDLWNGDNKRDSGEERAQLARAAASQRVRGDLLRGIDLIGRAIEMDLEMRLRALPRRRDAA